MTTDAGAAPVKENGRSQHPRRLPVVLFGELRLLGQAGAVRATTAIEILGEAGVAAPAARAMLDRLVVAGFLARDRAGRWIEYTVTDEGAQRLRTHTPMALGETAPGADADGFTLVTFTVPEMQRNLRYRLRAALAGAGYALLNDGVWIAPGRRDAASLLAPLREQLPASAVQAFHAAEAPDFSMVETLRDTWDLDTVRDSYLAFIERWGEDSPGEPREGVAAVAARVRLACDWLDMRDADPALPSRYLGDDWPAQRAREVYLERKAELEAPAAAAVRELFRPAE